MSALYMSGQYFNLLSRGTVTVSPGSDTEFPASALYDARPSQRWQVSAVGADPYVVLDTDLMLGFGSMETNNAGDPAGFTELSTGTGAMSRTTAAGEFNGGVAGMKLVGGTGTASGYRDVVVKAGERLQFAGAMKGDGTKFARWRVYVKETAQWVNSSGVLTGSAADIASRATATWATSTVSFTAPTLDALQQPYCTLRISGLCNENGTVFVDDGILIPKVNALTNHGHNIDALNVLTFEYSDDNSAYTSAATITMKQPAFYAYLSTALFHRYWKFKTVGTNNSALWLGELVIGYAETLTQAQGFGWEVKRMPRQDRLVTPGGEQWVYSRGTRTPRALQMSFTPTTEASLDEVRLGIMQTTQDGYYPIVFIPRSTEHYVFHGRVDESWAVKREFSHYPHSITFLEDPFPNP